MKSTRILIQVALVVSLFAPALRGEGEPASRFRTALTKDGSGIAVRQPPADFGRGDLPALAAVAPGRRNPFQVDLRGYDLSKLDLKSRLADLQLADFDDRTKWPGQLPGGFDPAAVMALGKDPGLGMRALHEKGITGKGVGIAIIDQGLLVDHVEYKNRLRLYEEIHCLDREAAMHGPAVASIAVGKTVGVAPEADLYYIAETHVKDDWERSQGDDSLSARVDFAITAESIDRILEINRALPKERKIRVVSLSVGWMPSHTGYREVMAAVERARQEGVFVISTALDATHGLSLMGLGREPQLDPDAPDSYSTSSWYKTYLDLAPGRPMLLVPMDSRATASPTGATDYVFYRTGGMSWAVPYVAGLYALSCQVKPDITPAQFWAKALETGDVVDVTDQQSPDPDGTTAKSIADQVERIVANLKEHAKGDDLEGRFGTVYGQLTGVKRERMSEPEFRVWMTEMLTVTTIGDGRKHQLGKIANPGRLIGSLQASAP